VPRLAGAGLVLLTILVAGSSGAYALMDDARDLLASVPRAVQRARSEVIARLGTDPGIIEEASRLLGSDQPAQGAPGAEPPTATPEPARAVIERVAGATLVFAGDLIVIFFLVYFLLISANRLRRRVIEISGTERAEIAATIIDDINTQIQRYLVVLLLTAIAVGTATWLSLSLMGVRYAATWGILAGIFNSMPYFGPVVVSGGLFLVGVVQEGGLTQAFQMSGAAIAITSLEGWLLTPALMGRAERMSALAVFLGVLVWTWIWGAWGTVLAVPMLVVIKSVSDHVGPLKPVGRLMAP
jgi:predicted PurR-regulated permease PerM